MRASVLITITHPSISIDSLSNSVDFRICPMPLGQQSITPLAFHRVSTFSTHYSICPGLSLTPVPNSAGLHTQSVCPSTWFANPPTFQIRSVWHPHPYLSVWALCPHLPIHLSTHPSPFGLSGPRAHPCPSPICPPSPSGLQPTPPRLHALLNLSVCPSTCLGPSPSIVTTG